MIPPMAVFHRVRKNAPEVHNEAHEALLVLGDMFAERLRSENPFMFMWPLQQFVDWAYDDDPDLSWLTLEDGPPEDYTTLIAIVHGECPQCEQRIFLDSLGGIALLNELRIFTGRVSRSSFEQQLARAGDLFQLEVVRDLFANQPEVQYHENCPWMIDLILDIVAELRFDPVAVQLATTAGIKDVRVQALARWMTP